MPLAIVSLNQTLYNEPIKNITAWDNVEEDSTWLQEFADKIRESANNNWDNQMVNNWRLDDITVSFIEGDHISYSVNVSFTQGDLVGNVLTDGMPGGSCILISTSFTGPKPNRGRIYFSGAGEGAQSDGQWDGAVMTAMKALVEEWAAGFLIQGITTSLQILRRPSAVFPLYVANPVQLVSRRDFTRSQRRRNLNQ